jgi:flavin reductase (DIM6/NTAB) family NADH-FMN oxidoreductase RutF
MELLALDGSSFDIVATLANPSVVVVAADDGHEVDACLVGFHSQCSIEPLRYAVWLSKANHTYRIAHRADVLSVHWLPLERREIAVRAGTSSLDRDPAKLAGIPWRRGPAHAIVLDDAVVAFAGRVQHRHDGGDHVAFVLEPFAVWGADPAPDRVLHFDDVRDLHAGHDPRPAR